MGVDDEESLSTFLLQGYSKILMKKKERHELKLLMVNPNVIIRLFIPFYLLQLAVIHY